MQLKSMSLASRLLLASCASAVTVVVLIVVFAKAYLIPQLTEQALHNQTAALAHSLKRMLDSPDMWVDDAQRSTPVLDSFTNHGEILATLSLMKEGKFVRVATTLKREDGSHAVGTAIDPASPAGKALAAGKDYSGGIVLFERPHYVTYTPLSFPDGTVAAVFVGIDYSSADSMLALATQMDYVVIGVGVLAVVLLSAGFAVSVRVEQTHREIEDIFRTTQEGLFLLDHELRMGSQTSLALSRVLGFDVRAGANFLDLLRPSVSPKTYDTAKEYIELLLRHDVKEKLVASLNPLDCLEISSVRSDGGVDIRFLQIRFNRVLKNGRVTHLLVTANDISRQVRLERELKESERRVQDQMAMMVHVLQAEPLAMQEFLGGATAGLNQINESLRTTSPTSGMSPERFESILRTAHQIKGDASALQLESIAQILHGLETLLQDLRGRNQCKGEDFLPVTVRVKELFGELRSIQEVIVRIGQIRGAVSVEPPRPPADGGAAGQQPMVRQWSGFVSQLAERHQKRVELVYQGLDLGGLAPRLRETINSVVNQFIRNALVHGIESPDDRMRRGKAETARLSVYVSDQGDGFVELSFRDDGRGLDLEKIKAAALASGRVAADQVSALDPRRLTMMIFDSGFSTRAPSLADEDAGRGVGLDAVKAMVSSQGGRIRIGSTRGEYCHFRVQLPLKKTPVHEHKSAEILEEVA